MFASRELWSKRIWPFAKEKALLFVMPHLKQKAIESHWIFLNKSRQLQLPPIQTKTHHLLNIITILLFIHSINSRWTSPSSMSATQGFSTLPWQGRVQLLASSRLLPPGCTTEKLGYLWLLQKGIRQKNITQWSHQSHRTYINYPTSPKNYFSKK